MKLKLLFFMGILSVFCNTVIGQNTAPFFQVAPPNRVECPGYVAANVQYQVSDANTPAPDLIVSASATGPQAVTFTYSQDPTGILRAINVTPVAPFVQGIVTVTITLSDVGNPTPNLSSTAQFTVNFQDITPPVFTNSPLLDIDVDINSGDCDFVVPDYLSLIEANDYCGGVVSMQTPAIGTVLSNHNTTQLIVLTVTDDYGNVASQSFTITLKDTTPPVVITQDITVSLDGTGNVIITPSQIDNGSNDNCSSTASLTYSLDLSSFTCADIGPNTVTLTVTDAVGNSATNTATVTVVDDIAPAITCPSNITVNNDLGDCGAIVSLGLLVSSDNCGVTATSTTRSDSLLLTDAYSVGVTTITWTAEDSSGNISSCTQTVTVNDAENPVAVTKNITVELDAIGNATISVSDIEDGSTDNCGIVASLSMLDITSFDCDDLGANTVVLTVEDAAGNTDTENATVTVVDLLKPEITPSGDENVDNDLGQCGALVTVSATTTDNCTDPISATGVRFFNDVADGKLLTQEYLVGTTTIVWTATDASGNVATTTQTITVNDVEAPTFSPLSDLTLDNDLGFCGYDISQLTFPNASDNCGTTSSTTYVINGDPSLTLIPVSVGPDHVPSTIVWTATDGNGNTATATQQILVRDLELPVMRTKDITRSFDANGQVVITAEDIDDGSTDNSGEACFTKYVVDNIIDCNEVGVHDVVLFGKDQWGNQHYSIAKVTTVDDTDPTFVDATLPALDFNTNTACTWVGVLPIPATKDNCSVVSVTNDAPAAFDLGTTPVIWTVTDAAGNMATSTQEVTVTDVEKPVAIAKVGVVVELDLSGDAGISYFDIDNGSTDNCGIVASLSFVSPSTFTCANVGANVVTLTVTDESGNVSTIDTVVTVVDNTVPALVTKPFTANLNGSGVVTVVASDVVDSSSDACGIKSTVVSPNTFTCANLGDNTITVTVTDNNNNVTTATAVVTVEDNQVPTITVTDIEVDTNAGCVWTGTLGLPVTADNCSVVSVTSDKAIDFAYPVGDTDVLWTVTDAAGLTATATQTVTVNDSELPIAKATDITIKLSSTVGAGAATITVAQVNNGSSDNCGIKSVTISKDTFNCSNVGSNTVVLTVTDNSDNVSTANAIVTVIDDILPVINPVSPIVVNTSAGICGANLEVTPSATATDNCTVGTPIGTRSDARALSATYPLGRTTITWNVKDANGNAALPVIQTVDVADDDKPTITTTPIVVDTNAGCVWTGTLGLPVTADNCSVASVTSDRAADFAYPVGSTIVTWTVKDLAGNTETKTQMVTVRDAEKPIALASDFTVYLNAAGSATITVAQVNNGSSDNCGIKTIDGLVIDKSSFGCNEVGANTVVLTVTDNAGNFSKVNAIVTVIDNIAPVITANYLDIDVYTNSGCSATALSVNASANTSDNCTVGAAIGTRSDAKALTADYPLGRTIITWNVKDANGNAAIPVIQTVDVTDDVAPLITTNGDKNVIADLFECGASVLVFANATDNCSVGTPTGLRSDGKPLAAVFPVGTTTITWSVTDANGNSDSETQTVIVRELVNPIAGALTSIILQLDINGSVTIQAADLNNGSTDNCAIASYTIDGLPSKAFTCANVGTVSLPFKAIDTSGNISENIANVSITIQDKLVPVITATANLDQTTSIGECGWTPSIDLPAPFATVSDNCSNALVAIGTRSDAKSLSALYPIGTTIITWKVTDGNGNVGLPLTTTVNVKDITGPTVIVKNIELVLVGETVSITPEDVLVSATDPCGVDVHSYSLDRDTFDIDDVLASQVTIYLTVKDIYGNETVKPVIVTFPRVPAVANEVITPNNDGTNDFWVIDNITNHPDSVVKVYNTWGSLVFSATNYQNNWDGKLNGNDVTLPDGGSYYYQIDLDGNGTVEEQGWLYITRQ